MKKSTATVTWITYRNFGTVLQAYALQKAISALGHDNHIIDDSKIVESFRSRKKLSVLRELRKIKWLYPRRAEQSLRNKESVRLYDEFINRYMNVDRNWGGRDELAEKYDVYIAGSDQIWSPDVPFDDFYYLAFTQRRKVSYAPSFGVTRYPDERVEDVKPLLESFSALSVREPQGAAILNEKLGLDAEVVSDPTLLLARESWESLIGQNDACPETRRPYALCYFLTYNPHYMKLVRDYCNKNSLQLRMFVVSHEFVGQADEEIYTGPAGFLEAVAGADVVLTDSFHGTIFSLIFERPFYTFRRFEDTSASSQNSRVENLLSAVQLQDRLVGMSSDIPESSEIDWKVVGNKISDLRMTSLNYLEKSLSEA